MKKGIWILSVIISVALFSCTGESAGDVNQDRIYTEYEQFYNSNTGTTTVIAIQIWWCTWNDSRIGFNRQCEIQRR